jgi:hypothetical protein
MPISQIEPLGGLLRGHNHAMVAKKKAARAPEKIGFVESMECLAVTTPPVARTSSWENSRLIGPSQVSNHLCNSPGSDLSAALRQRRRQIAVHDFVGHLNRSPRRSCCTTRLETIRANVAPTLVRKDEASRRCHIQSPPEVSAQGRYQARETGVSPRHKQSVA